MHRGAKRSQRGMREYNLQEKAYSCRPANQHRPLTAAIASAEASARADGAIVRLGVFLNPTSEAVFPVHGHIGAASRAGCSSPRLLPVWKEPSHRSMRACAAPSRGWTRVQGQA